MTATYTSIDAASRDEHATDRALPRLFVGGTGRSGTWLVYEALAAHRNIHVFPREMRFLTDPDGLMQLVDSLTIAYSPTQAREALARFERLMRLHLASPKQRPYLGHDLPTWLGADRYWRRLDEFCSELLQAEFWGNAYQVERLGARSEGDRALFGRLKRRLWGATAPGQPRRAKLRVPRYFERREDLIALVAEFVDGLFAACDSAHGKCTWCEKTPQNIYYLPFIWELFPDAVVFHVSRDPRGVVESMVKPSWRRAPNNIEDAARMLRDMYARWFDVRESLDLSRQCLVEIRVEDFASSPAAVLRSMAEMAGVPPDFGELPQIDVDRLNGWMKRMPSSDLRAIDSILGPYIRRLGYDL